MNIEEYKTELENLRDSIKELKERYNDAAYCTTDKALRGYLYCVIEDLEELLK